MTARIVVAYDTRNGSTAEVAQAIAFRLVESGCDAEVLLAKDVRLPQEFSVVIVGAPIYSGRWLSGAHRLLKRVGKLRPEHQPATAVFALGPRVDEGPENWVTPRAQFSRALRKHPAVSPVSTALFGGADPPKKSPRRDIRDWEAVRSWADELAGLLGCSEGSQSI